MSNIYVLAGLERVDPKQRRHRAAGVDLFQNAGQHMGAQPGGHSPRLEPVHLAQQGVPAGLLARTFSLNVNNWGGGIVYH